ncbi:serine/threonine-protein kinase [Actinomadura alba]|nr:serine/threonine-protein kinase [Actinomadura alba]
MPTSVGRYRIDRVLGSGAFASVWLGHDDALAAPVAIKVLSGSLLDDLDVRNRFLEEARILRRADSERLVRVHDIGELPDGRPYFVMSYADKGTLADRMQHRPVPVNEALALAQEIAYGVEVINRLGIIHRDLKPSNVLFQSTPDGGERLLIADLGLAKALAHASGAFTLPVGTPGYMSPEQARFGGGLDVRADVYGLGALTYHMLAGRAPGVAPVKIPLTRLRPELGPEFDQVVMRALDVQRENRWPTADAFAEALKTLRPPGAPPWTGQEDSYGTPGPPPPPQQGPLGPQGPPPASYGTPGPPPPPREPYGDSRPPTPAHGSTGRPPATQDEIHTSEVRVPGQSPSGDETMVDHGTDGEQTVRTDGTAILPQPLPHGPQGPQGFHGRQDSGTPPRGHPMQPPPGGAYPQGPPGPPMQPGPGGPAGPHGPGGPGGPGGGSGRSGRSPGRRRRTPDPGGADGAGKKKWLIPAAIAVGILVVALIAGRLLGVFFSGDDEKQQAKPDPNFTTVSDGSGKLTVTVPKAWPKQPQATWLPTEVALADAQQRPVLRATPSFTEFRNSAGKTPGVFIGLTTDVAAGKLPPANASQHPQCTKSGPEDYARGQLKGTITRYTKCTTGTPSISEIGLTDAGGKFGLWIRIKQVDGKDLTKQILDSVVAKGP